MKPLVFAAFHEYSGLDHTVIVALTDLSQFS